jgi:hypothetical protein
MYILYIKYMKIESISYIIISAFISYIYFMLESISNYNLGKDKQTFKWNIVTLINLFKIPPFIELFKISLSVGIFAILSSITFKFVDYIFLHLLKK